MGRASQSGLWTPDIITIPDTVRGEIDEASMQLHGLIAFMVVVAGGVVFLAVLGIYGVVWLAVGQRTKEMGIRAALGATMARLMFQLMGSTTRPVIAGVSARLLLAAVGSVDLGKVSAESGISHKARHTPSVSL